MLQIFLKDLFWELEEKERTFLDEFLMTDFFPSHFHLKLHFKCRIYLHHSKISFFPSFLSVSSSMWHKNAKNKTIYCMSSNSVL